MEYKDLKYWRKLGYRLFAWLYTQDYITEYVDAKIDEAVGTALDEAVGDGVVSKRTAAKLKKYFEANNCVKDALWLYIEGFEDFGKDDVLGD